VPQVRSGLTRSDSGDAHDVVNSAASVAAQKSLLPEEQDSRLPREARYWILAGRFSQIDRAWAFRMKWAAVDGVFEFGRSEIVFRGQTMTWQDAQGKPQTGISHGIALSSDVFAGGEISAEIKFKQVGPLTSCEIVFFYDSERRAFVSAALGCPPMMYAIRQWDGSKGIPTGYAATGDRRNLKPNEPFRISVVVQGSRVRMLHDGVEVLSTVLPFPVQPSQTGLYCFNDAPVTVRNFRVEGRPGRVFVVMQFTSPFNELFAEVITKVCAQEPFKLEARRADDAFGPGVVMADIINDIVESEFVIAEITPVNPNVYYELGYAHAIGKPVIMLANRKELPKLPFDVAASRVLLYEDSIAGRGEFEDQLRRHIAAILQKRSLPTGKGGLTQR
jgi:hypothetical protein